ncbi:MAG: flagellar motor protein MotA [Hyphomicrobiales bacterium]|nr:flagellar motor protein MotA [Hyphomicrobiales bacterium]MCP5371662.1 flagellar motor protein MotA [Hyphomicrobiales bacterium]
MTRPQRYLIRMLAFVIAVLVACAFLFNPLREAFMANAALNGLIVGVLVLGIIYNFRQVVRLYPEVHWMESFQTREPTLSQPHPPRLLAPMARMLGERKDRLSLSALAMRSLLDGIVSRLDESRDLSRYTIGLLIFLGLLGTFWGLLGTIASISDVIGGLSTATGDVTQLFGDLKAGLAAPLEGMGTAFSSSLFGLSGSLVLGFLDLQAGQAQNRFYTELEDWMSSITRLGSGAMVEGGDQSVPAYVQALLEQTAESLENLQRTMARGEENRMSANASLVSLSEKVETLTDHMQTEQTLMLRLAENQIELKPLLEKMAARGSGNGGMDESTRGHIRNLDVYAARMLEEMSAGRDEIIHQMRSEIKLLARTIAAIAEDDR